MDNNQIIQKIKEENLKPISKNIFLLKKIVVWFLLFIATVFGAYSFAFFFLKTLFIDFDHWYFLSNSYDRFLIENIPIVWITLFTLSILSIYLLFKNTNKGYKYSILLIASLSLIVSFILGMGLSKVLAQKGILIERFERERVMQWTNPDAGRISGEVLFVDNDYILVRDINDDLWNVSTQYLLDDSRDVLKNDQLVSIIGKLDYDNNFTACQIMPFDMDKYKFRPSPGQKMNRQIQENQTTKDICNFVINQK